MKIPRADSVTNGEVPEAVDQKELYLIESSLTNWSTCSHHTYL